MSNNCSHSVLIADDEVDILELVAQHLTSAGFHVIKAFDGMEALEKARGSSPSLIVLDLMMPKMSGTEVLRALKNDSRTAQIPVVMLTARRDEVDRIVNFELGVDDYVIKPFSPRELTLRIKSILSRRMTPVSIVKHAICGDVTFDSERHEIRVGERQVELTAVEFRLLSVLFSKPGRVFSREELLNTVWGIDADIEIRTVDTHLRRMREKLGDAAEQIHTVRGFGYRLNQPG